MGTIETTLANGKWPPRAVIAVLRGATAVEPLYDEAGDLTVHSAPVEVLDSLDGWIDTLKSNLRTGSRVMSAEGLMNLIADLEVVRPFLGPPADAEELVPSLAQEEMERAAAGMVPEYDERAQAHGGAG